jgi:DNA-binding NtrC family response regulator
LRLLQPRLAMILTTGHTGSLTAARAGEIGFQELMEKPATARTLGETVDRVLRGAVRREERQLAARHGGAGPGEAQG